MSDLDKYLNQLGENTSGGSHDAVIFAGKGLEVLMKGLGFSKKAQKQKDDEKDEDQDKDRLEDDDEDKDEDEFDKNANGGDLEEEDEDKEDPADGDDSIISNHGVRTPKSSLRSAVTKHYEQEERRFQKSLDEMLMEHEEVIDAVPAIAKLTKSVSALGKSTNAGFEAIVEQNKILAKGLEYALKAVSGLSADMELIKKQPASSPETGLFFAKNLGKDNANGNGARRLSKSDVEDILTECLNEGKIDHMVLAKAAVIRSQSELDDFVSGLPQDVQARLNA